MRRAGARLVGDRRVRDDSRDEPRPGSRITSGEGRWRRSPGCLPAFARFGGAVVCALLLEAGVAGPAREPGCAARLEFTAPATGVAACHDRLRSSPPAPAASRGAIRRALVPPEPPLARVAPTPPATPSSDRPMPPATRARMTRSAPRLEGARHSRHRSTGRGGSRRTPDSRASGWRTMP